MWRWCLCLFTPPLSLTLPPPLPPVFSFATTFKKVVMYIYINVSRMWIDMEKDPKWRKVAMLGRQEHSV